VAAATEVTNIFKGHSYQVITNTLDYATALATSAAYESGPDSQSNLVRINSADENEFVYNLLLSAGVKNLQGSVPIDGGGAQYAWISGSDELTEGEWVWRDSVVSRGSFSEFTYSELAFQNWGVGGTEPDNFDTSLIGPSFSGEQNYAALSLDDWPFGNESEWNDIDGVNTLFYVIETKVDLIEITGSVEPYDITMELI